MKPVSKSFAVVVGAVALLSLSVTAFSQGYDGVLAPTPDAAASKNQKSAPAPSSGYSGVLAPVATPKKDEAAGYEGVIPGKVDKGPAVKKPPVVVKPAKPAVQQPAQAKTNFTPIDRPRQQSSRYIAPPETRKVNSGNDLANLAQMYSFDKNYDGVPDSMAKRFKLPEATAAFLSIPRNRNAKGMLPLESTMKTALDNALSQVTAKQADPKTVADSLKRVRDGLRAKGSVPDSVYKSMGMPELYVKEEREGIEKSIKHVDEALRQLGSL